VKKSVTFVLVFLLALGARAEASAPAAYKKCRNCHGTPGGGGTKAAPDLAESELSFEQFRNQALNGSEWEGKPPKNWKYRWKKMPPQVGLSDSDLKALYEYIKR